MSEFLEFIDEISCRYGKIDTILSSLYLELEEYKKLNIFKNRQRKVYLLRKIKALEEEKEKFCRFFSIAQFLQTSIKKVNHQFVKINILESDAAFLDFQEVLFLFQGFQKDMAMDDVFSLCFSIYKSLFSYLEKYSSLLEFHSSKKGKVK